LHGRVPAPAVGAPGRSLHAWPRPEAGGLCGIIPNSIQRAAIQPNAVANPSDRTPGSDLPSKESRGLRQLHGALLWSLAGLDAAWRHEASFRLEASLFVILLPLGLWLGNGASEKALLGGSLLLVLAAELLNSAIEAVADKLCADYDELIGRAKDLGSAAVFILLLNAGLCWVLVLWARFGP
jgi:diacylglycerol kinase (ATP)